MEGPERAGPEGPQCSRNSMSILSVQLSLPGALQQGARDGIARRLKAESIDPLAGAVKAACPPAVINHRTDNQRRYGRGRVDMIATVSTFRDELADREAIRDCIYLYSRGLDRCDADLLASVFWPDARIEADRFTGKPADM